MSSWGRGRVEDDDWGRRVRRGAEGRWRTKRPRLLHAAHGAGRRGAHQVGGKALHVELLDRDLLFKRLAYRPVHLRCDRGRRGRAIRFGGARLAVGRRLWEAAGRVHASPVRGRRPKTNRPANCLLTVALTPLPQSSRSSYDASSAGYSLLAGEGGGVINCPGGGNLVQSFQPNAACPARAPSSPQIAHLAGVVAAVRSLQLFLLKDRLS